MSDIFASVGRIEAHKFSLVKVRDNLKRAVKALEKADELVPRYGIFVGVHDRIREAADFIEWQATRLKVPRSGGPGEGTTERKRRAVGEAYALIRHWQNRVPDGKDMTFINLASQLHEAATGRTETLANCARQCATFVKEMQQA